MSTAVAAVEMVYSLGWMKTAEQAGWPHPINSVFCKLDLANLAINWANEKEHLDYVWPCSLKWLEVFHSCVGEATSS